ncbi:hypothetical protein RI129_003767 [Pyrocoelia pectoralis]|uniref:Uncharacterized protein n=1 Tax=Pyrocoelia pectoralis TaxID=417401 RepID=A0AAN7ZIW6_9COLE
MIERFHRQLKAALMCHDTKNWYDTLPIVLLGIRTAWKEDLSAAAAEMVYGETIRIPGEFLNEHRKETLEPENYVAQLRRQIQALKPVPTATHGTSKSFVFQKLSQATQVFLRNDTAKKPLQRPYDGPYTILKRGKRTYTLNKDGTPYTVTAERVKPAFTEEQSHTPQQGVDEKRTRSGRRINHPVRFNV